MSMSVVELFRHLWEDEFQKTLAVLEAIPGALMHYAPWPGAMDTRRLALHVVGLEDQMIRGVLAGELVAGGSRKERPEVQTPADLIAFAKAQHQALQPLVAQLDQAIFDRPVPFRAPNGAIAFTATGWEHLFSKLQHHLVHHRGQLLVYLRLNGATVPGLYGPAKEQTPPMP